MSNGKSTIVIPEATMMDYPFEFFDGAASVLAASVLIELVHLIIGLALLIIALALLIIEQIVRPPDVLVQRPVRRPCGDDFFCELRRSFRILVRVGDGLEIRMRGGEYAESRVAEQGFKVFFKVFSVDPVRTLPLVDDHRILA